MSYLVNDVFPAGIVLPYAGSTAPAGWLLCDGTSYIRNDYLRLFNAIGTAHGSLAGNAFNVPDYRGRFLRGTDNMGSGAAGRDPNTATRTVANVGGNTGNNVGSVQTNATAKNGLGATAASSSVTGSAVGLDLILPSQAAGNQKIGFYQDYLTVGAGYRAVDTMAIVNHEHTLNGTAAAQTITVASSDAETRPLNAYVNYIIKI